MDTHTVLHNYQYLTPRHVSIKIRQMKRICCQKQKYLDCCIQHAEVTHLCTQFSKILQIPEISDPEQFLQWYIQEEI